MGKTKFQNLSKSQQKIQTKRKLVKKTSRLKRQAKQLDVTSRLMVRNLSYKTTPENLKEFFGIHGKIIEVNLPKKRNGDLVGCAYVQFENYDDAKQALNNKNNQAFLGRSLQINWAYSKKTPQQDEDNQTEVKSEPESDGESQNKNKSDGYQPNRPKFPRNPPNVNEEADKSNRIVRKARLIVRNISFKATEETLKQHFEKYGDVVETVLLKKQNGDLVGCGFVQFKSVTTAKEAMSDTNSKPFLGRPIHVDWAVPKFKYMSHITQQKDEEEYLKNEVKSEPESDEDVKPAIELDDSNVKSEPSDNSDDSASDGDDDNEEMDDESKEGSDDEPKSNAKETPNKRQVTLNDAEDGRTVFFKNVPFGVTNDDLKEFVKKFGEFNYALVCIDKLTEHSKGTAFVQFKNKEDAEICMSSGNEELMLQGQKLEPLPALLRDHVGKKSNKKQPKDLRNLYLIKEGLIMANSKAATGVSASDMAKRLSLEQNKSQMLRNLNRFISRYRLTIHNIPRNFDDERLKKICLEMANVKPYALKECRVMKDLNGALDSNGKYQTKGYGFVTFTKHEDALTCLRRMNNNPSVFDKNNRPIVGFSVEDKVMINARKKRLEKSIVKNPLHKGYKPSVEGDNSGKPDNSTKPDKPKFSKPFKKNFKNKPNKSDNTDRKINKNVKPNMAANVAEEFTGETAMPGALPKMRSRYKLKLQANMHRDNLKNEKRKQKRSDLNKIKQAKEKVRQPRQKMNTSKRSQIKKMSEQKDNKHFMDLVNKYKSKLQ